MICTFVILCSMNFRKEKVIWIMLQFLDGQKVIWFILHNATDKICLKVLMEIANSLQIAKDSCDRFFRDRFVSKLHVDATFSNRTSDCVSLPVTPQKGVVLGQNYHRQWEMDHLIVFENWARNKLVNVQNMWLKPTCIQWKSVLQFSFSEITPKKYYNHLTNLNVVIQEKQLILANQKGDQTLTEA